jgi:hypothetical protein
MPILILSSLECLGIGGTFKIPILVSLVSFILKTEYDCLQWGIAYCVKGGPEKEQKAMQVQYVSLYVLQFIKEKKELDL